MTDTYWHTAEQICTQAELAALRLRDERHLGTRTISLILGISRSAVRERLDSADRKIQTAIRRQEPAA